MRPTNAHVFLCFYISCVGSSHLRFSFNPSWTSFHASDNGVCLKFCNFSHNASREFFVVAVTSYLVSFCQPSSELLAYDIFFCNRIQKTLKDGKNFRVVKKHAKNTMPNPLKNKNMAKNQIKTTKTLQGNDIQTI